MDNVCRSKFEDRLNRFKSYGQKSGQIWVCESFFEKSRGIFIGFLRFFQELMYKEGGQSFGNAR